LDDPLTGWIGKDGNGARLGGLPGELCAVMMSAGQCDVEVTRAYQPRIHGDTTNNRATHRSAVSK